MTPTATGSFRTWSRFPSPFSATTSPGSRANFTPARRYHSTAYLVPIGQGTLGALGLLVVWGTIRGARRVLTRPVDMARIRYVARFRLPRFATVLVGAVLLAAAGIVVRLLLFFYEWVTARFLLTLDSFLVQATAYALMLTSVTLLGVLFLALVPRKLLVFDDRLLVKCLAYRSVPVLTRDVEELRWCRFREVWLTRRLWNCVPLTFGLLRPGIYLRARAGRAYFFRVRDNDELLGILSRLLGAAGAAHARDRHEGNLPV